MLKNYSTKQMNSKGYYDIATILFIWIYCNVINCYTSCQIGTMPTPTNERNNAYCDF